MVLKSVFVVSTALIVYHHAAYPVVLRALARRNQSRPSGVCPRSGGPAWPSVTVIVPAHNESGFIEGKIANIAALRYPRDRLKAVIVCDGCTDDTVEKAQRACRNAARDGLTIDLVVHDTNRGKVAVLNEAIARSASDLIALSDTSADVGADALIRGVEGFRQDRVGVVCGTYRLGKDTSDSERAYWSYQTALKADEAALGAPMGAHGAFYMFRRALWEPLETDTVNDDFILPMRIVAQGRTALYDTSIVATERERTTREADFARRRRIGAGNLQQVLRLPQLADPRRPGLAFVFLSGKGLRAFIPWLAALAFLTGALLAAQSEHGGPVLAAQAALVILAAAGSLMGSEKLSYPVSVACYLLHGYVATLLGTIDYAFRRTGTAWRRIDNDGSAEPAEYLHPATIIGKRVLDVIFAGLGLAVLALVFLPIAAAIKLDSPGPIFYRQLRVGRCGTRATDLFYLVKFRTMRTDAEAKSGAVWAVARDPRVTRVGMFLRKTRLDELPQCLNVLRGEMSVVGPRPERPQFFPKLKSEIPFYSERTFGLKPGITGLAQVSQGYDSSIEDVRSKTLFDHAYALRIARPIGWLLADIEIIVRTLGVVVLRKGQ